MFVHDEGFKIYCNGRFWNQDEEFWRVFDLSTLYHTKEEAERQINRMPLAVMCNIQIIEFKMHLPE